MGKYEDIVRAKVIPSAEEVASGAENDDNDSCLLLILHFSAPPYISFNYGFIIKMMYVTDNDKLAMRVTDLEKDNEDLKETVNALLQMTRAQQQQIKHLIARFEEDVCSHSLFLALSGHSVYTLFALSLFDGKGPDI